MALFIDKNKCARCGSCEPECPQQAIFQTEDAFVINPKLCNECVGKNAEPLCAQVCSSDAIHKIKSGLYKKLFG